MMAGSPVAPNTLANAVANAALEERPAPTGRVVAIRHTPPIPGLTVAMTPATNRAHDGSRVPTTSGSGGRPRGRVIPCRWRVEKKVILVDRVGVNSTVVPRSMAIGRAIPRL